jgi:hypothetical protein
MFVGTEFNSLKKITASLFSLNTEFVLKYLDDELEYVTLENQDDFLTALEISPNLLRIQIQTLPSQPAASPAPACTWKCKGGRRRRDHCRTRQGCTDSSESACPWKGRNRQGCTDSSAPACPVQGGNRQGCTYSSESACPWKGGNRRWHRGGSQGHGGCHYNNRKSRLEKKLIFIEECLKDLAADDSKLTPQESKRKQRLIRKKQRLEGYLNGCCTQNPQTPACPVKRERRVLSPQEEQLNSALKNQILEVRAQIKQIKARERELKLLPRDQGIQDELVQLKERKALFKTQKRSLWEKMHS